MKKCGSVLLVLMLLCACIPGVVLAEGSKLVVGTMPLTVGVPVQHALEQGYYADEGLDVEVIIFPTGAPINEAYGAGQLDVAVSGLASVFSLALGTTHWIGEITPPAA